MRPGPRRDLDIGSAIEASISDCKGDAFTATPHSFNIFPNQETVRQMVELLRPPHNPHSNLVINLSKHLDGESMGNPLDSLKLGITKTTYSRT